MRLFFWLDAVQAFHGVRYFHLLALMGAASVGFVTWLTAGTEVSRILIWCSIIFTSEAIITIVNLAHHNCWADKFELRHWAWLKVVAVGCNGVAWSLGPVLLHVDNVPISVLAPIWGVVNIMSAAVAAGAFYAPSMVALVACATIPATLWLASFGTGIELAISVCIGVSLPFLLAIGYISVRETGEAIEARLKISDLLDIQKQQTRQIRDAHLERNRFFSAASHDLRQPLHAMGFYVSLLPRATDPVERGEILSRLSECASSLDRQFNAIMGVADTDAAVETASLKSTSLQRIVDRVVANFRPEAEMKSIALRVVQTSLWARIAPELLERILANLVSNAIKYTPAGGVLVGVRRQGSHAHVMVIDTGIGIAEQDQLLIFQDFYQIANLERNRDKGFGLGLGIVRRLCLGMNWPLQVRSSVGKGTGFSVRVPLADEERATASEVRDIAAASHLRADRTSVLFVDDDPLVRDAMGRLLSNWDFKVELCRTGAEAIAVLQASETRRRWHVLLDYRLAGNEDGLRIADRIRAQFGGSIQITMMTAEATSELLDEVGRREITLLRKPVKPIRLRATLTAG